MNIAPSQSAPASASIRPDVTTAASDVADAAPASGAPGFGAMLSKTIADGAVLDGKAVPNELPTLGQVPGRRVRVAFETPTDGGTPTARATTDADAATAPVDALRAALPTSATPDDAAAPVLAIGATVVGDAGKADASKTGKAAADDTSDDDVATAGSDLAAQLALVSQWAGLAPHSATAAVATRDAGAGDALDIKGKLDAVRAAPVRAAAAVAPAVVGQDPGTAPLAAAVLAAGGAVAPDRDPLSLVRATGSASDRVATRPITASLASVASTAASAAASTAPAVPAPVDAKILDLARAIAPDAQASTVSPLIADLAGHAAATETSSVNAFLAQVASQLAQQAPSQVTTVASTAVAVPTDTMREPVGTPAWSQEVGQVALRMAASDLQNVSLHLNPEHLGPMDVQVRVDNGVAHLQFAAAHGDTRQALEASRPTLDQLFSDQGIKLGDWSVGQQSSNASFARDFGGAASQGGRSGASGGDVDASDATVLDATVRTARPLGLVDTFA